MEIRQILASLKLPHKRFDGEKTREQRNSGYLYQEIAQSLNLPVHGVNLPENFILSYLNTDQLLSSSDVLFYINPFNGGIVFTREDINTFIKQMNLNNKQEYYKPVCQNILLFD
jgi:regulator of sirC expression with transglutaminase-like and TPR domain